MKILNAFPLALLVAAGCESYPPNQNTYGTSTYGTQSGETAGQVISSPTYATNSTYTAQSGPYQPGPYYSSGVSQGAAASTQILSDTDRALVSAVRQALNNNQTVDASQNIYITSRNGVVTLSGNVSTDQDRQFIDNVVRNTSGVYSVNDQLQVMGQPTGAVDPRVYSASPVVANASSAGNIFNLHVQGLNDPDRALAQRILQELRTDTILPSLLPMVNITVSGGQVTLEGNVQNEQQRRTIESVVQRATGGQNVNDLLQVR